tara:strand:+ start:98 stop:349 length:252 start_codon:yes stop_codon:yes gene_type:complete
MEAIQIIEEKRKFWQEKWITSVDLLDELEKEESIKRAALESRIDVIQEAISDYTDMIETLKELSSYQDKCEALIINHLKKSKW